MSERLDIFINEGGAVGGGVGGGGGPPPPVHGAAPPPPGGGGQPPPSFFDLLPSHEDHSFSARIAQEGFKLARGGFAGGLKAGAALAEAGWDMAGGAARFAGDGRISGLDTRFLGDVAQSLGRAIPIMSGAVDGAIAGLRSFTGGLDHTVNQLGSLNGQIAAAQADAGIAGILGNIRRANQLEPSLTPYIRERSRLEQAGQDTLATLIAPVIPQVTEIISVAADFLKALPAEQAGQLLRLLLEIATALPVDAVKMLTEWIRKNLGKPPELPADNYLSDIMQTITAGGGFGGRGAPGAAADGVRVGPAAAVRVEARPFGM